MGRIGLDANVFLSVLLPEATKTDRENVEGSERILNALAQGDHTGVTSSMVFAEIAWAFLREDKATEEMEGAKYVLESMSNLEIIPVSNDIAWGAGKRRRKYYKRGQISYQDAIYLTACVLEKVDVLYTSDPDLLDIEKPETTIKQPKDF
ncbi:MAG: PIN domain-containing protein [Methanocellales archaeon]|nr:PIN domain-containing protein [Methanocellales archaeon]